MSKLLKLSALCIFLFSGSQVFAGGTHLVMTHDAKGDVAGCVALNKKYNELAMKLVPDNYPTVRTIRAAHAGPDTGAIWVVVEFDDLADMARVMTVLEASKEANALQKKIGRKCPMVSSVIGEQLYYHEGTK